MDADKGALEIRTKKVSGGGICAALCMVLLYLSTVLPAKAAILFATSIVMGICILRYKSLTAFLTYFAVSALGLFLAPKCAGYYIVLFGIYPLLKLYIERIKNIIVEYIIKFVVWNIHLTGLYIVLNALGQGALLNIATFWIWLCGIVLMLIYDLVFGIVINAFYSTYSKYL
ncbi:MAG: hypothetical protein IKV88_07965 [Clostridia bacterium]|nr:hypothetical protein [Clostridia bacterium]